MTRTMQDSRPGRGVRLGMRTLRLAAMLVALAAGLSTPEANAQVLYGSLVGQVKDTQGASIPGAVVAIVNRDNGLTREATTDEQGNYSLINVLAGPYDVKVTLTGFKEMQRESVPVSVGQVARVDVTLEVGALTETVTVESSSTLLQTDKAD